MSKDRDLTTTRSQVFGDVDRGTECRICGRNVEDQRMVYCSDYCSNLATAVMRTLNWSGVRRRIIDRDEKTCQHCGFDMERERRARDHIRTTIEEHAGERPEGPGLTDSDDWGDEDWSEYFDAVEAYDERKAELKDCYGDPYERARTLEVDHITPIAEGGHPFDPANLQTLCSACHQEKTAAENSERGRTPSASELNELLFEYVAEESGGENA
jgi:5-methylcytosine-specific restriction endonuclease McrA